MSIIQRLNAAAKSFMLPDIDLKSQSPVQYGSWMNSFDDLMNNSSAIRVDTNTLYHLYNSIVDLKRSIKYREENTMKEGYKIIDRFNPEKDPNPQQTALAHLILNSPSYPFRSIVKNWVRNRCVAGNHFLFIQKTPRGEFLGLKSIDPRTMHIVADQYGNVKKYIQRVGAYDPIEYKPEEIIHTVLDESTVNPILGVSPIESIVWDARTELNAQMSNYYFYENNAVPSHLMIISEHLKADQVKQLDDKIKERFKGAKNKWKSGIIPYVKDIKTITPSQKEMQYIESRKFYTRKIVVAIGVDSFLLGYTEGVQRSNARVIKRECYESTLRPDEVEFEECVVNLGLFPRFGLDRIKFVALPSNYEDEKEIRDMARQDKLAGIITANEARALQGFEPHDNELANELMFQGTTVDDLSVEEAQTKEYLQIYRQKRYEKLSNLLSHE